MKVKKAISLILSICILLSSFSSLGLTAFAETEGDYDYRVSSGEATISKYNGTASVLVVPSTLGGYPVTVIGNSAFNGCSSLTSITLPDSLKSVGYNAFYKCQSLTGITIPDSVTIIDDGAFSSCSGLTSVILGSSLTQIDADAFKNCSSLTSIAIPDSVTSIGNGAFDSCTGLTSITVGSGNAYYTVQDGVLFNKYKTTLVKFPSSDSRAIYTIPDSVTSIAFGAFDSCSNLESVTIPDSVKSIGNSAFYSCKKLTGVEIPYGITSIGDSAFRDCTGLTSVTIPDSVTSIGNYTFYRCSGLTNITIPNSVTSIGSWSFYNCENITALTLGNSVESIGNYTFNGCSRLQNITLPDSMKTIGNSAFAGSGISSISIPKNVTSVGTKIFDATTRLTRIDVDSQNENYSSVDGVFYNKDKTVLINFPNLNAITDYVMPDTVTDVEAFAAHSCHNIKTLKLSENLVNIGEYAFCWCNGITELILPDKTETIGKYAFSNCNGLEELTIPSSVKNIGENAFNTTSSIKKINYTGTKSEWNAITIAGNNDSLKSAVIHCSDGLIYEHDSSAESEYKLVDGVLYSSDMKTLIEYPADKKDKEFVIPGSVTTIAENAFKSEYLEKVTVSKNVSKIGNDAFKACTNLKSVIIEDGTALKTLDNSFSNLPIKDITLGKGIEVIGESALEGTSVEKVVLPETARVIKTRAFANINNNLVVVIPDDVYDIQVNAFVRGSGVSGKTTFVTNKNSTAHKYAKKNGIAAKGIGSIVVSGTYVYSGTAIVPRFVVYDFNDKPLKLKSDYTVIRYENNINAGKNANIVIKGAGDYRGLAKNKTFTINPAPASRLSVTPAVTEKFYTGKVIYPSVKVTDTNKKAVTSYKMSATAKKIGLNTVTLTFSGNYTKTRNVSVIIKPKAVKTKKLRKGRGAFVQKWTKIKGVSGYQVIYSLNKNMSGAKMKNVSSKKKNLKVKKLQSKKRYYVRVRAYVTVNGKKYYGKWSKKRSVKTK